jgi:preprotein translocase subunit SecE
MAKSQTAVMDKTGPVARLRDFFHEVKTEMSKVTWPTREELKASTSVVLVLLVILSGVVGVYDIVFQFLVLMLLKLG